MALALYRKYRPAKFAEVVGQEHVTEPLGVALTAGRINHAYLFSGPRGCGKTSSARILARSLNCELGPTPDPCGVCPSCIALAPEGPGSIDVVELDAASHGGVDDARELRDRAFYAPAESRYRVFIVDEAHMVTTQGFNALLKIVEEPPDHLVFIFATTEPEKVLPTIRSRTHHYPFRLIPPGTLRALLERICAEEGVTVAPAVYPLVIRAGGGSARDTLSVLDQLLAGAGEEGVTYERAVALLGVTDVALVDDVVDGLAAGDSAAVYEAVDRLVEAGHDPRRFAADLMQRLRDLMLLQAVPDAAGQGIVEAADDEISRMMEQAGKIGPATLARYGDIVHTGLTEMRGATAPRLLLELLCARMLLPAATTSDAALLERLERLERRASIEGPPEPGASSEGEGPAAGKRQFARPSQRRTDAPAQPPTAAEQVAAPEPRPTAAVSTRAPEPSPVPGPAVPQASHDLTEEPGRSARPAEPDRAVAVAGGADADEERAPARPQAEVPSADRPAPAGPGRPPAEPPRGDHPAAERASEAAAAAAGTPTAPARPDQRPDLRPDQWPDQGPDQQRPAAQQRTERAEPAVPPVPAAPEPTAPVSTSPVSTSPGPAGSEPPGPGSTAPAPTAPASTGSEPPAPAPTGSEPPAPMSRGIDAAAVRRVWPEILSATKQRKMRTHALLVTATVRSVADDTLVLAAGTAALARLLSEQSNLDIIADALNAVLGVRWRVRCEFGDAAPPAQAAPQRREPAVPPGRRDQGRPSAERGAPPRRRSAPDDGIPLPPEPPSDEAPPEDDEEAMMAEAAADSGNGPVERRDPEEAAIELLAAELGAKAIDRP
ncbi:DNA polymerase III subunit gamma and tau [Pseudonocardia dioxanivorans]|uniref:DNA polymerase III subunit gamma and tau n=2 Tax=Pseudonocardia dioxanivorans TaxID=240495 RepID=UPI0010436A70|nr:DNA polymerase III subunit gamma and tau [Pseudonocardia dioxanivorans]